MMDHLGRTEECNVSCKPDTDTRESDPFVTTSAPVTKPLGPTREIIYVRVETLAAIATQASMLLDPPKENKPYCVSGVAGQGQASDEPPTSNEGKCWVE
jgi:hypothetical protein